MKNSFHVFMFSLMIACAILVGFGYGLAFNPKMKHYSDSQINNLISADAILASKINEQLEYEKSIANCKQ